MPPLVRFAAVDDHPVLLDGIGAAAERHAGSVRFVGTAPTVSQLLEDLGPVQVVLLDLRLGDQSRPADNVRRLRAEGCRVLVYTEGDRHSWIADAVSAGAQGVLLKSEADGKALVGAVRQVAKGEVVLTPEMAVVLERDARLRPRLSVREGETLRLLAQGLGDKQIARAMEVGEATIKENLKRIRTKYAERGRPARSRVDLHQRALQDGLADVNAPDLEPTEEPEAEEVEVGEVPAEVPEETDPAEPSAATDARDEDA